MYMGLAHVGGKKTQILATAAAVSHTASPIWSSLCTQWNTSNTPCNMGRVDIYVSSNPAKQREWEAGGPRQDVGGKAGDERGDVQSCPVPVGRGTGASRARCCLPLPCWLKTHQLSAPRPTPLPASRSQKEAKADVPGPGIFLQQQPLKTYHVTTEARDKACWRLVKLCSI